MGRDGERFPVVMQRSSVRSGLCDSDNRPGSVENSPFAAGRSAATSRASPASLGFAAGGAVYRGTWGFIGLVPRATAD
jgi:hypothetical protein